MQRILISAFVGATLTACSAPPAPKDPVDVSIEPLTDEEGDAPPPEEDEQLAAPEPPSEEKPRGNIWGDDQIGESYGAGGLGSGVTSRGTTGMGGNIGGFTGGSGQSYKTRIKAVIRSRRPRVKHCYEQSLKRDGPSISGKLVVGFTIARDGTVSAAKADPGLSSPLDACVVAVIRGTKFPVPPNGQPTVVSYPFILTAAP